MRGKNLANLKYDQEIAAPADDDANVSWRLTRAAQLLGIEYAIIQAPFGGLPSQHLTASADGSASSLKQRERVSPQQNGCIRGLSRAQ